MRNIALILMYNGTAYHGWQVQKTEISVARDAGEGACPWSCGHPVKVTGCGRTDAGVHARALCGQFPHGHRGIPVERLPFAVNTHMPEDIVVQGGL